MAVISQSIPSFINGVSQQPSVLRLPTQVSSQDNLLSSVAEGLKKRPPTEHVADLTATDLSASHVHFINRDATEQYVTFFGSTGVRVFDLTGTEKTVTYSDYTYTFFNDKESTTTSASKRVYIPSGVTTVTLTSSGITGTDTVAWEKSATGAFAGEESTVRTDSTDTSATASWTSGDYLRAVYTRGTGTGAVDATITYKPIDYLQGATKNQFKSLTVSDYTFLVNQTILGALEPKTSADRPDEAIFFVKEGLTETDYKIYIDGTLRGDHTTAAPSATHSIDKTSDIAGNLYNDIYGSIGAGGSGTFSPTYPAGSSVVYLKRVNEAAFTARAEDSYGNTALIMSKGTTQKFTDLPARAVDGFKVKIVGDADDNDGDEFWVEYIDNAADETGSWQETVAPGLQDTLDGTTMPHTLVRNTDGTFTFGPATWTTRAVGDASTAPTPTMVGNYVRDVFFFGNRLGFLAGENVCMSEQAEYFNFWPTTVTTLLDTDRIDFSPQYNNVAILRAATQFQEKLVVFADGVQFVIDPGDVLSPRTVDAKVTTEFAMNTTCQPRTVGKNVYFLQNVGDYSHVRELYVDTDFASNDAVNATSHCPQYVPSNVFSIAGSSSDEMLAFLSDDEASNIYIYKYLWGQSSSSVSYASKLQSAWSKWTFNATDTILQAHFIDNVLWLVIVRADGTYLEKIDMQPGLVDDVGYLIHLDRKTSLTGSYNSGTDTTTWTLPYSDAGTFRLVLGPNWTNQVGDTLAVAHPTGTTLTFSGDYSANAVWVGREYTASCELSEIFFRQSSTPGASATSVLGGRLQLRSMALSYDNSGYFTIAVALSNGRGTYTTTFHGLIVGQAVIGSVNTPSGVYRFPIKAQAKDVTITLANDSHLPSSWLNASWEGLFVNRARSA